MASTKRTCTVEECTNQAHARGYCGKHYKRFMKTGSPHKAEPAPNDRDCIIDGCDGEIRAKGWCNKHYKRWSRHGDPLAERKVPPQNRPKTLGCKDEGCDAKHFAKGYCKNHYQREYHQLTIEARKATQREYRKKHRAKARETSRRWREENADAMREGNRKWYRENRDKVLEYRREYRARNLERILELNRNRRAREKGVKVRDFTPAQWEEVQAEWDHRCAYCGNRKRLTVDHVTPISKGGQHTKSNIVPACQSCNSKKGDRDPLPFWFERSAA